MARSRVFAVVPAVVGALLLAGCGDPAPQPGSGPGGTGTGTGSPSAPAPSSTEPGAPANPTGPGGTPPASGKRLLLDGVVEAGVEPGCRVLTAGGVQYLIYAGKDVPMGVPVRITAVAVTGVSTTCQQGTPLRVLDVQRR